MGRAGHILDPRNATLFQVIDGLGLTTNLELCLDAGDLRSYGTGMTWLDTSGNGYDFYRGDSANDTGSDLPTFNGDVGRRTNGEYWSFDGGDFFTYDSANETWMENLHKDSATFSLAGWMYNTDVTSTAGLFGTTDTTTDDVGLAFWWTSAFPRISVVNGSGNALVKNTGAADLVADKWQFLSVSMDEAAGDLIFVIDNTVRAFTGQTYSSPSAGGAAYTARVGSRGNGNSPLKAGSRVGIFAAWSSALTAAQLDAIYQATRGRFGA